MPSQVPRMRFHSFSGPGGGEHDAQHQQPPILFAILQPVPGVDGHPRDTMGKQAAQVHADAAHRGDGEQQPAQGIISTMYTREITRLLRQHPAPSGPLQGDEGEQQQAPQQEVQGAAVPQAVRTHTASRFR